MKITGNCHCGTIAYEAVVDPQKASLCHCTDCQTLSGAPFRASVPAMAEDFHLLRGQPKIYIKTAASGAKRAQAFCAECGTPIYASAAENPTQYNLRLGAVAQRAQIPALKQRWCDSALSWAQDITPLPGSPQQ
ncbi:aldehyde-activating protein [Paraburkholderia acidicola]|uniref:Aldehyde-activating protein n=1 Tax=Paraburkholderia acidicola TaxID=1912599 RepID=A0A2A4EYR9_9BURK|nr:GFA family protein [Paraburkholderia acidicola]PCE25296.1 aldehyde-activating protein [Paraburkholderia acidicola]